MKELSKIKNDFPQLKEGKHYLDSAASSLTPLQVLDAVDAYYKDHRANIHRGLYEESVAASAAYDATRENVAKLIGAKKDEVIFTSGSTGSANMLVRMIEGSRTWNAGDRIVTTVLEHHGALVPLQEFAKRNGLVIDYIDPATCTQLDGVKLLSIMAVSNVLGTKQPVASLAALAHAQGALVICDATAAVGHTPIDVVSLGVDALWFSGHKILGPTGVGVLWVKQELLDTLSPALFGGDMVERVTKEGATWVSGPERFEAGTPNISGVIGLGCAVDYLMQVGIEEIERHTATLAFRAHRALEQLPGVHVISPCDPTKNVGIVSFVVDGVHAHDMGQILADHGVAVRAGHHCAMPLHKHLGIGATTRASFYLYNDERDIDALVEGVKKAQQIFS